MHHICEPTYPYQITVFIERYQWTMHNIPHTYIKAFTHHRSVATSIHTIQADIMLQIMYHFLFVIARTQNNAPYTVATITLTATLYGRTRSFSFTTMTQVMWDALQRYNVVEGEWTLWKWCNHLLKCSFVLLLSYFHSRSLLCWRFMWNWDKDRYNPTIKVAQHYLYWSKLSVVSNCKISILFRIL